jgi:hypothetical protein
MYRLIIKTDGKCPSCGRKLAVDPICSEIGEKVVYRKNLDGPWICSWNCGFQN